MSPLMNRFWIWKEKKRRKGDGERKGRELGGREERVEAVTAT